MARNTLYWTLGAVGLAALVGLAAASALNLGGEDGEDPLDLRLGAGGTHSVSATSYNAVTTVEADYEMRNVGSSPAEVTVELWAPDGTLLDSASRTVAVGSAVEVEVGHEFGAAQGPAGTYSATIRIDAGDVRVTEGGVDIDEVEDGEED